MGFLAGIMASMATSVVGAFCNILCTPLYDKMKASMHVLNAPESFSEDVKKLSDLMNNIKGMSRSNYTDEWLSKAEKIMQRVPQVLLERERSSSQNHRLQLSCCISGHGVSRCKLHKKVRKLTIQGQNIITCTKLNIEPVEHIRGVPNIEHGSTAERNLKQIMDMLYDDEVWSIGVWGPGGVGKTTLVNALNNKLKNTSSFSVVRLILLNKDASENQVQKVIVESLNLKVEDGMNTKRIADRIHNRLQREKFVLILDNIWESVNLVRIGIPENQKGSKVVLTTRLEDVCMGMKAKAIKIECLTSAEAWELFSEKAGDVVTDPRIRPLAEVICRECGDLPLALVAMGSAMRGKTNIHQWLSTVNDMKSLNPPYGIESQVYKPLKLSFDFLANETLKRCFLYCSLYPEGFYIKISELVQCWLAENIIDEQLNFESAYSKGMDLIENLKNSCLLEEGWSKDNIKMHDVVRDVAIWIGKLSGTFIVFSGHGISKSPQVSLPEEVEKIEWISFVDNKKIELPQYRMDFPKVTTILVCNTKEQVQVFEDFLKGFPAIRVLNLYDLQSTACSLLHLIELRALLLRPYSSLYSKYILEELPCEAKLMVLGLFNSSCHNLPRRIEKQTNLKMLDLSGTENLKSIEVDVILNLSALEVLDMRETGFRWHTKRRSKSKEVVLQDLSGLKSLKEVYLNLAEVEATYAECSWIERLGSFNFFHGPHYIGSERDKKIISIKRGEANKVGSFILHAKSFVLVGVSIMEVFSGFSSTDQANCKLESLYVMNNCLFSEEFTGPIPSYSSLSNLVFLSLCNNEQVRSISQMANTFGTIFPRLRSLDIDTNRNLEYVFSSDYPQMVLPELEEITVCYCGNMTEVLYSGPVKTQAVVPKLKRLDLHDLKSLQSLCNFQSGEQWQSLDILLVTKCPKLKKLPVMTSIKRDKRRRRMVEQPRVG